MILDVIMPSAFELAKFVRETSQVPILMLTTRAETENLIDDLDYMAKPYDRASFCCASRVSSSGVSRHRHTPIRAPNRCDTVC